MTTSMVQALQRLSGREMLINTETAEEFISNMTRFGTTDQAEITALEVASRDNLCMTYGFEDDRSDDRKSFVYNDGLAIIPVHGSLINRFGGSWGFVTGYNFIRRQMNAALDDDDVDAIVFDVNTPGGEASGCFELAREIIASRRVKPSLALVDALAASGGMAIAGSATKMYGIPSARIGSIGVYRQHVSIKDALAKDGVQVTFASAGEHKLDGSPYEHLPASVLKDWTQDANRTWDDFIALVSDGRDMEPAAVRETQARIYRADEALALGLIDGVWSTTEAISAFLAEVEDANPSDAEEDEDMDPKGSKSGSEATSAPVDYDRIAGMIGTAVGTAIAGVTRTQNITAHGKTKGQVALAAKLSANAAITEADAIGMIDDAAAAAAPAPKAKAKAKGKGQRAAADDGEGDGDEDEDDSGEGDDDGEGEGDGDEDGEDEVAQARAARQRQKVKGNRGGNRVDDVNHLDNAMSRSGGGSGVGGGSGDKGKLTGDAAATATLLGDYAQHTGTVLAPKKSA